MSEFELWFTQSLLENWKGPLVQTIADVWDHMFGELCMVADIETVMRI